MSITQLRCELIDLFDIHIDDPSSSFGFSFVPNTDDVVFELTGSNYQYATTPIAFEIIRRYVQNQ